MKPNLSDMTGSYGSLFPEAECRNKTHLVITVGMSPALSGAAASSLDQLHSGMHRLERQLTLDIPRPADHGSQGRINA